MSPKKKPKLSLGTMPPMPARAVVDEERAEAFTSDAQTPKRSSAKTSTKPAARKAPKNQAWRRMTLYVPHELAKRLQVRAVEEDRDISDVVADAVAAYLGKK